MPVFNSMPSVIAARKASSVNDSCHGSSNDNPGGNGDALDDTTCSEKPMWA